MLVRRLMLPFAVALTLLLVATAACGGDEGAVQEEPAATEPAATEATEEPDPSEPTDIEEAGATAIELEGDWLSAGAESIWLSDPPGSRIHRLDPESGETKATIEVPQRPCAASDFGFDSLWTATCGEPGLVRIDPETNEVEGHVPLPGAGVTSGEASVGAGEGAVWLVTNRGKCEACSVARVDPASLRVVARVEVREGAAGVRAGEGAVWVTNPGESVVEKIDPGTNRVVAATPVGPEPRFLAVGEGGVWTLNQGDGSVTKIDPETAEVAGTIPAEVIGPGGDITAGGGSVWARGRGYLLTRIDPETNVVVERFGPSVGSGAVTVDSESVWISAHDVRTVWKLPIER